MRKPTIFAAALAAALVSATAAADPMPPLDSSRTARIADIFLPRLDGPDFTIVMETKKGAPVREVARTIRRHGPWLRIDDREDGRTSTRHLHLPSGSLVEGGVNPDGPVRYLSLMRPELRNERWMDHRSFTTGRQFTIAGEPCEEWDVYRGVEKGEPTFHRFACVTPDGIELSHWTLTKAGKELSFPATATHISRAPVALAEIQPPAALLDTRPWLAKLARQPRRGFEVVLVSAEERETRIVRGRGAWRYDEVQRRDGTRELSGRLSDGSLIFQASIDATGRAVRVTLQEGPARSFAPTVLGRLDETILGHRCVWYDAMPNVEDAGQLECRTADGMVLKLISSSWGSSQEFVATRIRRTAPPLSRLLPIAELFAHDPWFKPSADR